MDGAGYSYPDRVGYVRDFRHVVLTMRSTQGTFQVRIQGSVAEKMPDFTLTSTSDNQWDYVESKDLEDGTTIDGDTGVGFTGTATRIVEVNTNHLRWLALRVVGYAAGEVTVVMAASPN